MARAPRDTDPISLDFRRLRQRRRMLDIPQRELAERVGVHRNAISYWETGRRMPTALDLAKLGRALGSPPWELYDVVDVDGNPISKPWVGYR
ncbi:MAG: helix-turn-helix transcriptional regulator [Chloroflexi bacterium]|nr:helix-turn-helix transcriptional regulator [Chloroflexota bacterium]